MAIVDVFSYLSPGADVSSCCVAAEKPEEDVPALVGVIAELAIVSRSRPVLFTLKPTPPQ